MVHLLRIVVHQLTAHEVQGGLVVQNDVVERVGDDLGHPNQACLNVFQEEQVNGSEQQAARTQNQPSRTHLTDPLVQCVPGFNHAKQAGLHVQGHGQDGPDAEQHHLAVEVVAHLDFFFVFLRGLVNFVVAQGLEEEVTRLTRGHGNEPGNESGDHGIDEQKRIGRDKADGADEVQRLIDAAVMVVTMIVKPLNS